MTIARLLPAARVGMGAQPPLPMMRRELAGPGFRRVGDVLQLPTITIYGSTVDSALQAMVSDIATNGCQQTSTPSVTAFQTAFNAQSTPNGGTTLAVDGLYGSDTQSAANAVNTQDQLNLTIPAGCVATAGTTSPSTTSPSTSSSSVSVTTGSPYTPYIVAGAVVATGLVGYAMWHHHEAGGARHLPARHMAHAMHRRRRR